jgi:toxoflavin synthase
MLAQARQDEAQAALGIDYLLQAVRDLGKIGDFDLVTAASLLNYAQTQDELLRMCQAAYVNLKPGGRFVTLTQNVRQAAFYGDLYQDYGIMRQIRGAALNDGTVIHWKIRSGEDWVAFDTYHLSPQTYEWALRTAGFEDIRWYDTAGLPPTLQQAYAGEEWQTMLEHPMFAIIACQKGAAA